MDDTNEVFPTNHPLSISSIASTYDWLRDQTTTSITSITPHDDWLTNGVYTMSQPQSNKSLTVHGDAEFNGKLMVKGKDLSETIEKIESRLGILHPNKELEAEWAELKELGDKYRAMEKNMLEQIELLDLLKKDY